MSPTPLRVQPTAWNHSSPCLPPALLVQVGRTSLLFIPFVAFSSLLLTAPPEVATSTRPGPRRLRSLLVLPPADLSGRSSEVGVAGRVVIPLLQMRSLKLGKLLLGLERRELGVDFSDLNVSAFYPDSCGFKATITTKTPASAVQLALRVLGPEGGLRDLSILGLRYAKGA